MTRWIPKLGELVWYADPRDAQSQYGTGPPREQYRVARVINHGVPNRSDAGTEEFMQVTIERPGQLPRTVLAKDVSPV